MGFGFFFDADFQWRIASKPDCSSLLKKLHAITTFADLKEDDPLWRDAWESYTRGSGPEAEKFKKLRWFTADGVANATKTANQRRADLDAMQYLGGAFRSMHHPHLYSIVLTEMDDDVCRHELQHVLDDSDEPGKYGSACEANVMDPSQAQGNIFYHELRGRIVESQRVTPQIVRETWKMYCDGQISDRDVRKLAQTLTDELAQPERQKQGRERRPRKGV